jgi:hypothetical protein
MASYAASRRSHSGHFWFVSRGVALSLAGNDSKTPRFRLGSFIDAILAIEALSPGDCSLLVTKSEQSEEFSVQVGFSLLCWRDEPETIYFGPAYRGSLRRTTICLTNTIGPSESAHCGLILCNPQDATTQAKLHRQGNVRQQQGANGEAA